MKTVFFILMINALLTCYTYAQGGVLQVFELPEKYIVTDESTNLLPDPEHVIKGRVWNVYSDRENNKTFKSPNKNAKVLMSDISFLEKFYVIDETDEYLHIVKENNLSRNLTVSRSSKDYGWIPKSKLLIWEHCLVSDSDKSYKRIIFYYSGTTIDNFLHTTPELNHISAHSVALKAPTVLYVYKETAISVLVGTSMKIDNKNPNNYAIGWISSQNVIRWDYPVCIEPNWDKEAVNERVRNHVEPEIFGSIRKAEKYQNGKQYKKSLWKGDNNEILNYGRPPGDFFRFPIITQHNDLAKVLITDNALLKTSGKSGYAREYIKYLRHPLFRKVLLMSRIELGNIIRDNDFLINAYYQDKTTGLQQAFLQLLNNKTGNSENKNLINLSIGEITRKLYGAKSESDLTNLKLSHLINYASEEPREFETYINHLEANANHLKLIFNSDKYQYSFKMFNEIYYWIPVTAIP